MNANRVLVAAFVISCLLIAWSEIGEYNEFPRPSRLLSAAIAYTLLGVVAAMGAVNLAAALGVGLNVAQIYQLKWANTPDDKPKNPFGI